MSQLRSASSLELEIQVLLKHYGQADMAADALIKKYENENLTLPEFEAIATFLLHCGFCASLTDLIVRKLEQSPKVPWGHFVEALFLSSAAIGPEIKQALITGASEEDSLSHLARSHNLDHFDDRLPGQRELRRKTFKDRSFLQRQELIQELILLKSQGLFTEEEKLLETMNKLFPHDLEIKKLREALNERLALDFVAKRPKPKHQVFIPLYEPKDAETEILLNQIEISMIDALKVENGREITSELVNDFALAQLLWENFEAALRLLDLSPRGDSTTDWLRAEVLLRARRFAEVLHHVTYLENAYCEDPDTIYGIQYLRAQALWGLNQRMTAIEILEGLVQVRPQYRSASALLDEWKEDFL